MRKRVGAGTDNPVTPGDWNVDPALVGVFGRTGASPVPATLTLQATSRAFDTAVTTSYGDLWKDVNALHPVIVAPGLSATLDAFIRPTQAGPVTGNALHRHRQRDLALRQRSPGR